MLKNLLSKLTTKQESPELLELRRKIEKLKKLEPKAKDDYLNTARIIEYVKLTTEINLDITEIHCHDRFE